MKGAKKWMMVVVTLLLLAGCRKNDKITISGYTATDEQGHVISKDTDDWRTNANVPKSAMNILDGLPIQNNGIFTNSFCGSINVFPNPNTGHFVLAVNSTCSSGYWFKYVIVDENLHSYTGNSMNVTSDIRSSVDISSLNQGLYRMYYAFYSSDNTPFAQGYGDIQKQ